MCVYTYGNLGITACLDDGVFEGIWCAEHPDSSNLRKWVSEHFMDSEWILLGIIHFNKGTYMVSNWLRTKLSKVVWESTGTGNVKPGRGLDRDYPHFYFKFSFSTRVLRVPPPPLPRVLLNTPSLWVPPDPHPETFNSPWDFYLPCQLLSALRMLGLRSNHCC